MKTRKNVKLMLPAIFLALFVVLFSQTALVIENKTVNAQTKNQDVKAWSNQSEPDAWTRLKNQFIWNRAGKDAPSTTNAQGC